MKKLTLLIISILTLCVLAVPAVVRAETEMTEAQKKAAEQQKKEEETRNEQEKKASEKATEAQKKAAEKKKEADAKAQEALKKACENRRESFKKRMEGVAERSQKRLEVLDKIAERVEAFDKEKNLNVPNFDQLLADVKVKRLAVHDAHSVAKERADDFDCDKEAGLNNVLSFKEALQAEADAFKDYKDSVKTLIKAVKTAAEAADKEVKNEN